MFNAVLELTKYRLSISVLFSSIAGYLIATSAFSIETFMLLISGGFFLIGASNGFNQVMEKHTDALMDRTKNRPIPSGRIGAKSATFICLAMMLIGIILLYLINFRTAFFGLISALIYLFLYTPLKSKTPLCVFFGAIPGAIPFMLGWVAATNKFGIEPGILFMIQFFWQFPHFWSIGWLSDDDYKKAGFIMLPTGNRDKSTALQIILYIIWMMIISVFPYTGLTGNLTLSFGSTIAILMLGIIMLVLAINLYNKMDISSASKLFYSSILYLTLIQIIYLIDKFL